MSEHTPGPWAIDGYCMARVMVADNGGWRVIADCDPVSAPNPNWRADARLVAAAPELLAALRDVSQQLEICVRAGGRDHEAINAALQFAHAAIAKVGKP